jgi:hypothetical protein
MAECVIDVFKIIQVQKCQAGLQVMPFRFQ